MSTLLAVLIPILIVFAVFFAIYRSVRGEKSTKLKSIGWLELLVAYLCVLYPIALFIGLGNMSSLFEKVPGLNFLRTFDTLMRLVLILASFYAGVCLWKNLKGAVRKVKIILIALLIFNVLVVKGIYNFAVYSALARADVSIPAKAVFEGLMMDIMHALVGTAIIVSWYIYLNRSRRVKEIFGTHSVAQTKLPKTERYSIGIPVAKDVLGGDMTQDQVDRYLKWGIIFSVLWLAGIGSLLATIFGFIAKKAINASNGTLVGKGKAWWCLVVGSLGIILWLPIIFIAFVNQF